MAAGQSTDSATTFDQPSSVVKFKASSSILQFYFKQNIVAPAILNSQTGHCFSEMPHANQTKIT